MKIKTSTEAVRSLRKVALELILANHERPLLGGFISSMI
jgi:NADH dehydrogenase/NADH:ubiquinone oxidoreductase subunit G